MQPSEPRVPLAAALPFTRYGLLLSSVTPPFTLTQVAGVSAASAADAVRAIPGSRPMTMHRVSSRDSSFLVLAFIEIFPPKLTYCKTA